jgi:hypothetical protein
VIHRCYEDTDTNPVLHNIEKVVRRSNSVKVKDRMQGVFSMKIIGIFLCVLGIVWGIFAFNMQTSVVTESKTIGSGQFAIHVPSMEVNNLGLLDRKRNHLLLAGVSAVIGVLLFGFGSLQSGFSGAGKLRKCPYCAESIQLAAIKCRHCGSDVNGAGNSIGSDIPRKRFKPTISLKRTKNTLPIIVTLALSAGYVVLYPTSIALDHDVCDLRSKLFGGKDDSQYESADAETRGWQGRQAAVKKCMESKGHSIKERTLAKLASIDLAAKAKVMYESATDPEQRRLNKEIYDLMQSSLHMEEMSAVGSTDNWQ